MILKPIIALETSVTEAIPAKEYKNLFISGLVLNTDEYGKQSIGVCFQYYNYDTKEFSDEKISLSVDNLDEEINRVPVAGPIVEQLITLLVLLLREQQLQDNPKELAVVRKLLGFK